MPAAQLTPFSRELQSAWALFRGRFRTAVLLSLLPLIPLLFLLPFLLEVSVLAASGEDPWATLPSALSAFAGLLALIGFAIVSIPVRAGLYCTFAGSTPPSVRGAFRTGLRRFWPLVLTDILVGLLLVATLALAVVVHAWYGTVGRETSIANGTVVLADLSALIVILLLSLPALVIGVWFAFAPVATALSATSGGFPALQRSVDLLRGRSLPVFGRLLGWAVVSLSITAAVAPLPVAWWLVPFLLTMFGTAFLVVVYRELAGT